MVVRNILVLLWGSLLLFSCEKNGGPDAEGQIRGLMDDYLEALRDSMGVDSLGVGLYVLSADRDMYVSAGFPAEYGSDIHFRVASNSKTFTAAAVLRLHEAGLLDIDDVLTDTIPGTARPYLPEGPGLAVPNAERISLRLLLQHRGGVFDVTNADIPAGVPAPYAGQRYTDYVKETQGETHTFRFEELIGVVAEHGLSTGQPDVETARAAMAMAVASGRMRGTGAPSGGGPSMPEAGRGWKRARHVRIFDSSHPCKFPESP